MMSVADTCSSKGSPKDRKLTYKEFAAAYGDEHWRRVQVIELYCQQQRLQHCK